MSYFEDKKETWNKEETLTDKYGNEYEEVEVVNKDALFELTEIPEHLPLKVIRLFTTTQDKRVKEETDEEYGCRRRLNNKMKKIRKRGSIYWRSELNKTLVKGKK